MAVKKQNIDYEVLGLHCEKNSRISEHVLDDFLLAFAAKHHGLGKKTSQHFTKYRHVTSRMEKTDVARLEGQFIIHKVFRAGGLIEKFLRHPALDYFRGEEREFLVRGQEVPWRFSFAEIRGEPADDFFLMEDVFSGGEYLLYSPGMTRIKAMGNILLWFNLTGFNGSCWQSYGPIAAYQCFEPDDILFFASEKNSEIEEEAEVCTDLESDPLPYMLLISGAAYPRTFHGEDEMIWHMSEYDLDSLDTARLRKKFKSEFDSGVYRFSSPTSELHPHFARIYFDENEKMLLFTAMTETGFQTLVRDFNALAYAYPEKPYLRVRPQMVITAELIMKRKIVLDEYEDLFNEDTDPALAEEVDKVNAFVSLVLDDINAGLKPDMDTAVRETGVSPETAEDVVSMLMEKRGPELFPGQQIMEESSQAADRPGKADKSPEPAGDEPLRDIYYNADIIRETEPWERLYETDIFGVVMPESKRVWFISVMGANGEFKALALYKGYEGLFGFYELQKNAETRSAEATATAAGNIFTVPHIMLSFTDREELEKDHLEALYESVSQKLMEELISLGYRPYMIEIRGDLLWGLTRGALEKARCIPVRVEKMPLLDEAVESLMENLMR